MSNKNVDQLANTINLIMRIPEGDALVQLLGSGEEKNNIDAVKYWLEIQKDLLDIEIADYRVQQLISRLQDKLEDFSLFIGQ